MELHKVIMKGDQQYEASNQQNQQSSPDQKQAGAIVSQSRDNQHASMMIINGELHNANQKNEINPASQTSNLVAPKLIIANNGLDAGPEKDTNSIEIYVSDKNENQLLSMDNNSTQQRVIKKGLRSSYMEPIVLPKNSLVSNRFSFDCSQFCLAFSVLVIGGIVLLVLTEQMWLLILALIFYYFECVFTGFQRIFYDVILDDEFNKLYVDVLNEDPSISVKATAFIETIQPIKQNRGNLPVPQLPVHAATNLASTIKSVPSTKEEKGSADGKTIRVREEIFSEQKSFDFKSSKDASPPLNAQTGIIKNEGLAYISVQVHWKSANEQTQNAYLQLKNNVIENAKLRSADTKYEEIAKAILFPSTKKCIVKHASSVKGKCFGPTGFVICSALLLSFPFRFYYLNSLKTLQLHIAKHISI